MRRRLETTPAHLRQPGAGLRGRKCVGIDMDEGSCENLPACTGHDSSSSSEAIVSNIIGQWGTWGSWSECSTDCGKGYRSWRRTCLSGADGL